MAGLTDQEKIELIDTHVRNLEYSKYNLELSLLEENAVEDKKQAAIDSIQGDIDVIDSKKAALEAEKTKLTSK